MSRDIGFSVNKHFMVKCSQYLDRILCTFVLSELQRHKGTKKAPGKPLYLCAFILILRDDLCRDRSMK